MRLDLTKRCLVQEQAGPKAASPCVCLTEYIRNGTAKLLTLFEPATGQLRVRGVTSTKNAVLHPWLKEQLAVILESLPPAPPVTDDAANLLLWGRWQRGLRWPLGLGEKLPPFHRLDELGRAQAPGAAQVSQFAVAT